MHKDWGLAWDFGIDDGQIEGLSPQEVFVLGAECGMAWYACEVGMAHDHQIHAKNLPRMRSMAKTFGMVLRVKKQSEDWVEVEFDMGAKL